MSINYIFSPFYWTTPIRETKYIQDYAVPKMMENYRHDPQRSPDWNVHTSYDCNDELPNPINWDSLTRIYDGYIKQFLKEYFKKDGINYSISGQPWYTAYGKNQTANTHEHLPDHFSVVHFLKFNPDVHWPVSFVNPNNEAMKLFITYNEQIKDKINFDDNEMGYYHPRFTPKINEGDLVIFPAQLEHLVEKSHSDEIRITIAMNINIDR